MTAARLHAPANNRFGISFRLQTGCGHKPAPAHEFNEILISSNPDLQLCTQSAEVNLLTPTKEEFLGNLYRMKRDCRAYMEEATKRGDAREAAEFREHLERVESMIEMSGGNPDT